MNGLRSALKKGLYRWLAVQDADFICLQEIRLGTDISYEPYYLPGYHCYFQAALKKGYSGVAILSKKTPTEVNRRLGLESADEEGRFLELVFEDWHLISLYMPSGSSSEVAQKKKIAFLDFFSLYLQKIARQKKAVLICGDWNIAHKNEDLKNWKANQNKPGFTPEERAWLDFIFNEVGFIDVFRSINQKDNQFTWWSNRANAFNNNVGWRIDYQIASPAFKGEAIESLIYTQQRFSDHAPLVMHYAFDDYKRTFLPI